MGSSVKEANVSASGGAILKLVEELEAGNRRVESECECDELGFKLGVLEGANAESAEDEEDSLGTRSRVEILSIFCSLLGSLS